MEKGESCGKCVGKRRCKHTWASSRPARSFSGRAVLFCGTSARCIVSRACIHDGLPFSSLGTPPKQCRVNLILIRARDSKRVDNIGESGKERERKRKRELERERGVPAASVPAGTRDESFSVSRCTSSSRSISVVSRLRGYFPIPTFSPLFGVSVLRLVPPLSSICALVRTFA